MANLSIKKLSENNCGDLSHAEMVIDSSVILATRKAYDGSNNLTYIGYSLPGCAENQPAWVIKRFTYESGNEVKSEFAEGCFKFDKQWDERENYDYS